MAGKVDLGVGKGSVNEHTKPVQTVRFEEGIGEHLEAKSSGDRSRFYFKDGS